MTQMSHFSGTLHGVTTGYGPIPPGGREPHPSIARRHGTVESGLETILRSPEGSVSIRVYEGEAADGGLEDRVRIVFQGEQEFELYNGSLAECDFNAIRTNTQEVES